MSTILNTLKKLEEEKSVLEQSQDIRGMVTQVETGFHGPRELERRPAGWIVFAILAILCAGGAWRFLDRDFSRQQPVRVETFADVTGDFGDETPVEKISSRVSGIPMTGIPGSKSAISTTGTPGSKSAIQLKAPPQKQAAMEEPPVSRSKPEINNETGLSPAIQRILETEPEAVPSVKVGELLQAARETRDFKSGKAPRASSGQIPGLSVKGIIFFSDNNPANYIIVSTSGNAKSKVKSGESVMGAVVESIESNQVVFSKNGERVAVGMGG